MLHGGLSATVLRLLAAAASLVLEHGLQALQLQQLLLPCSVSSATHGIFLVRDPIGVNRTAKQILNHWITREAPKAWAFNSSVYPSKRFRL